MGILIKSQYKKEFDSLSPRSGFEEETINLLRGAVAERNSMNSKKLITVFVSVLLAVVLLAGTVYAAVRLLTPSQVAEGIGDPKLAAAFESDDAVIINETKQAGDYNVTLMGFVSGRNLSGIDNIDTSYSYVCVAIERTDGTPLTIADGVDIFISPLVSGYQPWCVNLFSLSNGANGYVDNGVYYMLYTLETLEMFADREVALYVYSGRMAPGADIFSFNEESGAINYNPDYRGVRVKFDLPLDASEADPEAARQHLESFGFILDANGNLILE